MLRDGGDDGDGYGAPVETWLGEEVEDVEAHPTVVSVWLGVAGDDGETTSTDGVLLVGFDALYFLEEKKERGEHGSR